jgi:hypothetical protein
LCKEVNLALVNVEKNRLLNTNFANVQSFLMLMKCVLIKELTFYLLFNTISSDTNLQNELSTQEYVGQFK